MLVEDSAERLHEHIEELLDLGLITTDEADRLRGRVDALCGDLEAMYDRDPRSHPKAVHGG